MTQNAAINANIIRERRAKNEATFVRTMDLLLRQAIN